MRRLGKLLLLIFTIILSLQSFGQDVDTTELDRGQRNMLRIPTFGIYKDNYFLTGTSLNQVPSKTTSDVKFQISFRQLVYKKPLLLNSFLFISYTQKAFWDVYRESLPFRELNFNPSIGLIRPFYKKGRQGYWIFTAEHESNGKDSTASRSWNRLTAGLHTEVTDKLQLSLGLWMPFSYKEGNPDLLNYVGYGQLGASYILKKDKWYIDVLMRKGNQWNMKGSIQTQLYYKLFPKNNEYLMLQWFQGSAESLIAYSRHTSMLRVGLIIKPNLRVSF